MQGIIGVWLFGGVTASKHEQWPCKYTDEQLFGGYLWGERTAHTEKERDDFALKLEVIELGVIL